MKKKDRKKLGSIISERVCYLGYINLSFIGLAYVFCKNCHSCTPYELIGEEKPTKCLFCDSIRVH